MMNNEDFNGMTENEVREYVKSHPEDEEAFQYLLSIIRSKPGVIATNDEELEIELRRRLNFNIDIEKIKNLANKYKPQDFFAALVILGTNAQFQSLVDI